MKLNIFSELRDQNFECIISDLDPSFCSSCVFSVHERVRSFFSVEFTLYVYTQPHNLSSKAAGCKSVMRLHERSDARVMARTYPETLGGEDEKSILMHCQPKLEMSSFFEINLSKVQFSNKILFRDKCKLICSRNND